QAVLYILAGDIPVPAGEERLPAPQFDEVATFTLRNPHGLQARPSAVLVTAVQQGRSHLRVENREPRSAMVDAKNLMRGVSLG
ncbi:HPr family phosphocarrier protein, partial [Klebsiella pneumoniae]|uniref:HPr family phosphocarrier protein n=1 Tax=Klebsiella pneumoniae TaxID=573 RepID=UPI00272FCC85